MHRSTHQLECTNRSTPNSARWLRRGVNQGIRRIDEVQCVWLDGVRSVAIKAHIPPLKPLFILYYSSHGRSQVFSFFKTSSVWTLVFLRDRLERFHQQPAGTGEKHPTMNTEITQEAFIAAIIVPVTIATSFVAVRLANSYGLVRKFLLDDWFTILGLFFVFLLAGGYYAIRAYFSKPDTTIEFIGRMTVAIGFISSFGAFFAKLPILLLYLRLFGSVYRYVRISVSSLIIIPFFVLSGGASYCAALCSPDPRPYKTLDENFKERCFETGLAICIWNAGIAVAMDLAIFGIPIPAIAGLKLPIRKKVGVAVALGAGMLGITASAVALYYRSVALANPGKPNLGEVLGPVIECSIAVTLGCVPAVSSFWRTRIAKSPAYCRLKSAWSSKWSLVTVSSKADSAPGGSKNNGFDGSWPDNSSSRVCVQREFHLYHHHQEKLLEEEDNMTGSWVSRPEKVHCQGLGRDS
ncbi:hypothetical protein QBC35DRAFT_509294 [Podospora australis]|uniref:Rhodopsin domain-containing protein n=1 Tax=Podospora australis TaxID=1536484 RepID=A0AAN7ADQ5_9PEZI|nr:hypothetical protein QBC35DRAFT_509294 [Podospora australis]